MEGSYNARCPAVKRLLREAQELHEATEEYYAHPIEDNLFEWHFTVRGPPETEFEGGVYHGRIIMPAEYPMKPPNIIFFTPNGRFETNKKICLSISGHHPETWQPSWSIRTALLAIIGFMPTPANGTIGALDYTATERAALSRKSVDYMCTNCGRVGNLLKERTGDNAALQQEAKEVSAQMVVSGKKEDFPELEGYSSSEAQAISSLSQQNTLLHPESISDTVSVPPTDSVSPNILSAESSSGAEEEISIGVMAHSPITTTSSYLRVKSDLSLESSEESRQKPSLSSPPESSGSQASSITSARASSFSASPIQGHSSMQNSVALVANNIFLSAAVFLLIALVLRRLFLLESGSSDEMEDMLL